MIPRGFSRPFQTLRVTIFYRNMQFRNNSGCAHRRGTSCTAEKGFQRIQRSFSKCISNAGMRHRAARAYVERARDRAEPASPIIRSSL